MKDFLGHELAIGDLVIVAMGDPGHRHALGRITGIYKNPGWTAEVDLLDPQGRVIPWVHCHRSQVMFHSADYRSAAMGHIAAVYGLSPKEAG